jgi:hypothetical protein
MANTFRIYRDVGELGRLDQTDQTPMWALDPKFHY